MIACVSVALTFFTINKMNYLYYLFYWFYYYFVDGGGNLFGMGGKFIIFT